MGATVIIAITGMISAFAVQSPKGHYVKCVCAVDHVYNKYCSFYYSPVASNYLYFSSANKLLYNNNNRFEEGLYFILCQYLIVLAYFVPRFPRTT